MITYIFTKYSLRNYILKPCKKMYIENIENNIYLVDQEDYLTEISEKNKESEANILNNNVSGDMKELDKVLNRLDDFYY